jgi:hypothetical protein
MPEATPIACMMNAMPPQQSSRYAVLRQDVLTQRIGIEDLADGYGFRFAPDSSLMLSLAEFVSLERLCCPFLRFEIVLEAENAALLLRLRGREGVREFIAAEFELPSSTQTHGAG